MKTITKLYRRTPDGKLAFWQGRVVGGYFWRTWGLVGGKQQETSHAFVAAAAAQEALAREIKKKLRAGFSEIKSQAYSGREPIEMKQFGPLPKTFAPQKPIQQLPVPLPHAHNYLVQRKRDGQRHYAVIDLAGKAWLWSSQGHNRTAHMPQIVERLETLRLPFGTILDGEIICDRDGVDDFRATNEVCRSLPARAAENERALPLRYMVFDTLWWCGAPVWQHPYHHRYDLLWRRIPNRTFRRVFLAERLIAPLDVLQKLAKDKGWEGLVLWDRAAPAVVRMNGKPERHGCYKWKPVLEGDFVATSWHLGKGRLADRVGYLSLAEWRGKKLEPIGFVGTGFSMALRKAAMHWKYPCVVQVKYLLQQPDTRALREPVFLRLRTDKIVKECR